MHTASILAFTLMATPAGAQVASAVPAPASGAPVDSTHLAEARIVIAKLMPPGVYRTLMSSMMAPIFDNMGDSLKTLPLKQMAEMGGLSAKEAAALDKVNLEQVMAIYDPHWRERSQLSMRAMFETMGTFFTTLEPELREAYARAYANAFTLAELRDFDAFFASPAGSKFAARYLTIGTDPAIAAEMRTMMPKMMAQMPTFLAAAQKAKAALPPPRKIEDLTPADKAALAKALGVPESKLKDPKSAT
ncbi:MAG: DUF2059 domain-containing protein [Sphingomonadaceae bacterium]|nr:DUF2059 domain-containing protein [Sphingomonadaceae bacterium]